MQTLHIQSTVVTLHQELLDNLLALFRQGDIELSKRLSSVIYLSGEYLNRLYELIPENGFNDLDKEILFFKSIKPLFVAEREYHLRLYHASLFGTDTNHFWEQELVRMQKLLTEHWEFAGYYHSGQKHNDHAWFAQGQALLPTTLCMQPWETNLKHTSERDGWVAGLLAVERYRDWLKAKMDNKEK